MKTKRVNILDLKVGDVVHFYGARFEITSAKVVRWNGEDVAVANGKWLDGVIEPGYFGPKKDWSFQGNSYVSHEREE